jgi:hypothetical protein
MVCWVAHSRTALGPDPPAPPSLDRRRRDWTWVPTCGWGLWETLIGPSRKGWEVRCAPCWGAVRGFGTSGEVQPFLCMNVVRGWRPSGRQPRDVWIAREWLDDTMRGGRALGGLCQTLSWFAMPVWHRRLGPPYPLALLWHGGCGWRGSRVPPRVAGLGIVPPSVL